MAQRKYHGDSCPVCVCDMCLFYFFNLASVKTEPAQQRKPPEKQKHRNQNLILDLANSLLYCVTIIKPKAFAAHINTLHMVFTYQCGHMRVNQKFSHSYVVRGQSTLTKFNFCSELTVLPTGQLNQRSS